ncbi:MAG: hypothetical protein ACTSQA_09280 [Candidatus Heimdallarchaeaceae archaeon]
MAIALDSSGSTHTQTNSSNPLTFAHTCTGDNLILFVSVGWNPTQGNISSVTYNSVGLTLIDSITTTSNGVSLWYLIAPATGGHNVVITPSTTVNMIGIATSYTGAKQTGQPDASSSNGPTSATSFSPSLTTVADNCWAIFSGSLNSGAAITAGSNTAILNQPEVAVQGTFNMHTNSPKTPAGTDTMNATCASSAQWQGIMASFAPVAAPTFIPTIMNTI